MKAYYFIVLILITSCLVGGIPCIEGPDGRNRCDDLLREGNLRGALEYVVEWNFEQYKKEKESKVYRRDNLSCIIKAVEALDDVGVYESDVLADIEGEEELYGASLGCFETLLHSIVLRDGYPKEFSDAYEKARKRTKEIMAVLE